MESESLPILRIRVVKFLIQSAQAKSSKFQIPNSLEASLPQFSVLVLPILLSSSVSLTFLSGLNRFSCKDLEVAPIVKYSALSLFADRFLRSISGFNSSNGSRNWLLHPITESNLQLFSLVSLWISGKFHTSHPLSVKLLKSFADKMIKEQHFMTRDLLDAEVIFMQVLNFEIGTANITFIFLEELLIQFKEVAKVGELVNWEACMDVMDLLYEKEETSVFYSSPCSLAASVLVAAYLITVPVQEWEFPILPWVEFVMPIKEEDIVQQIRDILVHVFETDC